VGQAAPGVCSEHSDDVINMPSVRLHGFMTSLFHTRASVTQATRKFCCRWLTLLEHRLAEPLLEVDLAELVQAKLLRAGDFDDAVHRRAHRDPADGLGDVVSRHGLDEHRGKSNSVAIRGRSRDAFHELEELRRVNPTRTNLLKTLACSDDQWRG
jgi:hypothetical protein